MCSLISAPHGSFVQKKSCLLRLLHRAVIARKEKENMLLHKRKALGSCYEPICCCSCSLRLMDIAFYFLPFLFHGMRHVNSNPDNLPRPDVVHKKKKKSFSFSVLLKNRSITLLSNKLFNKLQEAELGGKQRQFYTVLYSGCHLTSADREFCHFQNCTTTLGKKKEKKKRGFSN